MKPILFNTEMVRAILEGRKTVTRRVINRDIANWCDKEKDGTLLSYENSYGDFINPVDLCRYRVGDVLYVRETWRELIKPIGMPKEYDYKADTDKRAVGLYKWKPSIHMPKEAARIFLRVTDVRVEQLQDITREQVHKEGIPSRIAGINTVKLKAETLTKETIEQNGIEMCHIDFANLWNSTIKKDQLQYYSWNANPYVWVIEFERIEKPAAVFN